MAMATTQMSGSLLARPDSTARQRSAASSAEDRPSQGTDPTDGAKLSHRDGKSEQVARDSLRWFLTVT